MISTWYWVILMLRSAKAEEKLRSMLRIPWVDRVTNRGVMETIRKNNLEVMNSIKRRKLEYLAYIMRNESKSIFEVRRTRGAWTDCELLIVVKCRKVAYVGQECVAKIFRSQNYNGRQ
ncbi:hypothetical protein HUJ04_003183 [Dendroctonus ponderosae]|nr:hypothetical protein HUJ04_003183 [Dendroctonus ponderosae]